MPMPPVHYDDWGYDVYGPIKTKPEGGSMTPREAYREGRDEREDDGSFRQPPTDALWSRTIDTRFGPDYVWLEGVKRLDGSHAIVLGANETTDPIDGWQTTDITLERADLEHLKAGIDGALAWLDSRG